MLLEGYDDITSELRKLSLPSLKLEGLFMAQTLSYLPKKLTPLAMPGSKSVTTNGGLMSPRSPSSTSSSAKKLVNPALVTLFEIFKARQLTLAALSRFTSSRRHLAMNIILCPVSRASVSLLTRSSLSYTNNMAMQTTCKYSHDYELTPEQRAVLANNAKKGPCNFLKSGEYTPMERAGFILT